MNNIAYAATIEQVNNTYYSSDYKTYTNSDNLILSSSYTIHDYPRLIGNNAHLNVSYSGGRTHYSFSNLEVDDSIVEIVPKQLFFEVGSDIYMGEEYGFFIKTTNNDANYMSTVMVFDITTETNLEETIDKAIVSVAPIFQYKYIGLTDNTDSIIINNSVVNYQLNGECVIALPYFTINGAEYVMTEDFYLKDISFGASLYNEQALNRGDANYNPYEDYGSFFTGYDYSYKGKHRVYGEFPAEDLLITTLDTKFFYLGALEVVPIIGDVVSILGTIYDGVSLANDWISLGKDIYNCIEGEVQETQKTVTATSYYQNRDDQLSHYKDANNIPYLVKNAIMGVNTNSDNSIWYGTGDNVTGYFNISHSALNERQIESTRFTNHIVVKVVDSNGDNVVATGEVITQDTIRSPYYKDIQEDIEEKAYLLPNGQDYFSFVARYSSDYAISVGSSENLKIDINNVTYQGTNINVKKFVNKNGRLNIKIYGNTSGQYIPIIISTNNAISNNSISANSEYLLKIDNLNGVKNLKTNNNNILIKDVLVMDNKDYRQYQKGGQFVSDNEISYVFDDNNISYYLILNNTSQVIQTFSLTISNVSNIMLSNTNNVNLTKNLTYFKFVAPNYSGDYVLTVNNTTNNDFIYKIFDENLNESSNGYSWTLGEYNFSADANKTYYIAITTGQDESNVNIKINKKYNAYQWRITYDNNCITTSDRSIKLVRGKAYLFEFLINGNVFDVPLYSVDDSYNCFGSYNINLSLSSQTLYIPLTTPIGGDGIEIFAKYNNDASYDHTIRVIPEFEGTISQLTTYNNDDIGFNFVSPKYVSGYYYSISIGNKTTGVKYQAISSYYNSNNYNTKSILSEYNSLNYNFSDKIIIKITKLSVSNAVNSLTIYDCNYVTNVESLYGGGDGSYSNPYQINCRRHFENIRKYNNAGKAFILLSNIDLKNSFENSWVPIPDFYGTLKGNGKTISNMCIKTSGNSGSLGLFESNLGIIENLTVTGGIKIYNQSSNIIYAGMIAGVNCSGGTIRNCQSCLPPPGNFFASTQQNDNGSYTAWNFEMYSVSSNSELGGICGRNQGNVISCVSYADIFGKGDIGGVSGTNHGGNISSSTNNGELNYWYENINRCVGGITGYFNGGTISNCRNQSPIKCVNGGFGDDTNIYPAIGQIIGRKVSGTNYGNTFGCNPNYNGTGYEDYEGCFVDQGKLHSFNYGGFIGIGQKHHNQAMYVKNEEIGQIG